MEIRPIACNNCGTVFKLNASADENLNLKIDLRYDEDNKINKLVSALLGYWRWVTEGQIPYGNTAKRNEPYQYYHDNYHYGITKISADGREAIYRFNIQTYDSPDGDTWWKGKFLVKAGKIEILEEGYEHR
jgi:hypothetical protein